MEPSKPTKEEGGNIPGKGAEPVLSENTHVHEDGSIHNHDEL